MFLAFIFLLPRISYTVIVFKNILLFDLTVGNRVEYKMQSFVIDLMFLVVFSSYKNMRDNNIEWESEWEEERERRGVAGRISWE